MRLVIKVLIALLAISSYVAAKDKETTMLKSFGEEFTIKEGQTAFFRGSTLALKITGFSEGVCAIPGFNCGIGWMPPAVRHDLILDGRSIDNDFTKPIKRRREEIFDVAIKESDFKTYAIVAVSPLFEACKVRGPYCWEELAWKSKDVNYCDNIDDLNILHRCQDNIVNVLVK